MVPPAQVNHVSSQSVLKRSSIRSTKRTKKSTQVFDCKFFTYLGYRYEYSNKLNA